MEFFTSDIHRGHKNIIGICNRPFQDIFEMDKALIENHNSLISDSDTCYILGDYAFRCSAYHCVEGLKQLNGKLVILFGNHDKPLRSALNRGLLDKVLKSGKIQIIGTTERTEIVSKTIRINGVDVLLSHYAFRTWPKAFRGAIHLFGHSHNNLSPFMKSMDVGIDARNYYPISFDGVMEEMSKVTKEFKEE